MSSDPTQNDNDSPLSAAVAQKPIGQALAEQRGWDRAALIGRTITINRPRDEVYAFWRDFRNLAQFLENIDSVEVLDDRRSHWVIKAPHGVVEWDALLTEDQPGAVLAWEAADDAQIRNTGRIEFRDAPPGRGTEVTATIVYDPPAGDIGRLVAKLFQKEPKMQVRRDLRRFKQLMETGEISTSEAPDAAPRG
ncbi:MAG: SRPBCC family protein [Gallionellaceae bacterium]|nr:MAG: SRPBCC family protein [Gallionellaceae bacterium]